MELSRKQGVPMLAFGLLLLTGGVLVLIAVPAWGSWIADYPAKVMQQQVPQQAAPTVQAMLGIVFGPLLNQVGGYIRIAGYFAGSLITIVALLVSSVATMLVTKPLNV